VALFALAVAGLTGQHFGAEHWQQQAMLASAARTATTYGPWVKMRHTDTTIWCVGDVTVSNTTGTLDFGIQACNPTGDIESGCTESYIIYRDDTHLAVVARQFILSELAIDDAATPGLKAAFFDSKAQTPLPPVWRIVATHASGNESTYSVDCAWW